MRHNKILLRWQARAGATRLDVMVVGALVVAALLGVGVWAFQSHLIAKRSVFCRSNLKQWALALHIYHGAHRCFPPYAGGMLQNDERLSGSVALLPFLGHSSLWSQISTAPGQGGDPMNLDLAAKPTGELAYFVCPASSVPLPVDRQPHLSYAFCVGDQIDFGGGPEDFPNQEKTRGAFGWRHGRRIQEISDGTANTILMAERDLSSPRQPRDIRGRVASVPATSPADCLATSAKREYLATIPLLTELRGERWSSGHPFYAVFTTALPPNGPSCAASSPRSGKSVGGWFTASSRHEGGCHVMMADGCVRFINEKIDTGELTATQPGHWPKGYPEPEWSSYGVWGQLGTIAADGGGISF